MSTLPFLIADDDAPVAWRAGRPITARQVCEDVAALAARLPEARYLINLCDDRYHFLVGLAAALSRGQVSLLPPSRAAGALAEIAGCYDGAYCLTDGSDVPEPLERVEYAGCGGRYSGQAARPAFPAGQIAVIAFTSGTTGAPTPHPKTWGSLVKNAEISGRRLIPPAFANGGVLVGTIPHQHMYGLESTLMMPLRAGIAIHSGRPFYPNDLSETLSALPGPRIVVTTPIHLRAYVGESIAMPEVALVISATSPLSPALAGDVESLMGCAVEEIYGCTESGAIASRRTTRTSLWQTYDGIVVEERDGRATVRGGHLAQPVSLSDVIEPVAADTFELRGRDGDMVNIGGKRTSLAHLNHQLGQIAGVRDSAVFIPDGADDGTIRLAALVVAPGLTPRDILGELRKRVDVVFLPRPVVLVDALPRTETGKLPRALLIDRLRAAAQAGGS